MATVLITGANRGIGLELARRFAERGDTVVALCRDASDDLRRTGARIETGVDVRSDSQVAAAAVRLADLRFDRVVLNAGVLARDALQELDDTAMAHIVEQFEVNALGPLRVAHAMLPLLAEHARIAIITSRMGSMADNGSGGYYGYRMSKAAVNAAGRSLAMDLRPRGVTVLLLHPGYVRTDMTEGKGDVTAAEAAAKLVQRIDTLGLDHTGEFWHANGTPLPW